MTKYDSVCTQARDKEGEKEEKEDRNEGDEECRSKAVERISEGAGCEICGLSKGTRDGIFAGRRAAEAGQVTTSK